MEQVFLIEKLAPVKENKPVKTQHYEPIGWVETEEEAQKLVDDREGIRYRKIVKAVDHE